MKEMMVVKKQETRDLRPGKTQEAEMEREREERLIGRRGIGYTSTLFYIYLTFTRTGDVPGP